MRIVRVNCFIGTKFSHVSCTPMKKGARLQKWKLILIGKCIHQNICIHLPPLVTVLHMLSAHLSKHGQPDYLIMVKKPLWSEKSINNLYIFSLPKQWSQLFMCSISLWCGTFCRLMAHPICMVVFWWRQFLHNYRSRLPAPGLDLFFTWGFRCERLSACSLLICNWQSYFIENGKVTANWFYSDSDGETMNVPSIQSAI